MTIKVPNPHVALTEHAVARIRQRTDLTPAAAKHEIREALRHGELSVEGRNVFLARCGDRQYPVARASDGRFIVLTVLLTAGLAVAA